MSPDWHLDMYAAAMAILRAKDIAGRQIRQVRRQRGWTAEHLASRFADAGISIPHTVITETETGRRDRRLPVDEVLAFAHILAVPPLALLIPGANDVLQVVPGVEMDAAKALEWMQGDLCETCHGKPAAGFTCNTCGRAGS